MIRMIWFEFIDPAKSDELKQDTDEQAAPGGLLRVIEPGCNEGLTAKRAPTVTERVASGVQNHGQPSDSGCGCPGFQQNPLCSSNFWCFWPGIPWWNHVEPPPPNERPSKVGMARGSPQRDMARWWPRTTNSWSRAQFQRFAKSGAVPALMSWDETKSAMPKDGQLLPLFHRSLGGGLMGFAYVYIYIYGGFLKWGFP